MVGAKHIRTQVFSVYPALSGNSLLISARTPGDDLVLFRIALLLCTRVIVRAGQPSGSNEPQFTPNTLPLPRSTR